MRFDETGLGVAVGTAGGLVALFDLRARRPTVVKDHMYGQRITDIKFHTSGDGNAGGLMVFVCTGGLQFEHLHIHLASLQRQSSATHCSTS